MTIVADTYTFVSPAAPHIPIRAAAAPRLLGIACAASIMLMCNKICMAHLPTPLKMIIVIPKENPGEPKLGGELAGYDLT